MKHCTILMQSWHLGVKVEVEERVKVAVAVGVELADGEAVVVAGYQCRKIIRTTN